jgi:cell division septation protein DedD
MAVENDQSGGQLGNLTENEDMRRRALLRLGVAGVVTAAALAGLWWLDQGGGKKAEKPVPAALPAPIVSAPIQESAPPQPAPGETAAEQAPAPEQAEARATGSAKLAAPPEPPPPPKVSNVQKTPSVPAAAPRPTPAQPPATLPAPPGERFVVQLGVFSDPARARELVNKLRKQGIRAHIETRVQLGPFANREEAEKTQAEMRKLGVRALVTPASAMK